MFFDSLLGFYEGWKKNSNGFLLMIKRKTVTVPKLGNNIDTN